MTICFVVLGEAYEAVDDDSIDTAAFRAFTFDNAVRFYAHATSPPVLRRHIGGRHSSVEQFAPASRTRATRRGAAVVHMANTGTWCTMAAPVVEGSPEAMTPRRTGAPADGEPFDIGRDTTNHLSFSHGVHYCPGARLRTK
ncbi:unannotated protein [freshwater metagenome]|uniref:Unannotated protein n=1 Tax=freshwater metagenome TaxID=449393 RepID=A0A6J6V0I4_9ZZZZ